MRYEEHKESLSSSFHNKPILLEQNYPHELQILDTFQIYYVGVKYTVA